MGLLKRIKSKTNVRTRPDGVPLIRSLSFRRKPKSPNRRRGKKKAPAYDDAWDVKVTSNPREYSVDSSRFFDWVTNKMDDFEVSNSYGKSMESSDAGVPPKRASNVAHCETGWGLWFSTCWGSPDAIAVADEATYPSSYSSSDSGDSSKGSSQPALSKMINELDLNQLKLDEDDVSDITSAPSVDTSSSSESEQSQSTEETSRN